MGQSYIKFLVSPNGETILTWSGKGVLERMGNPTRTRASRVYPQSKVKRAFWWVCRLVGLAEWTRRWRGPWIVDLRKSNGPVVGPFRSRSQALTFEVQWLERNWRPS